jgi:hypothetical protein
MFSFNQDLCQFLFAVIFMNGGARYFPSIQRNFFWIFKSVNIIMETLSEYSDNKNFPIQSKNFSIFTIIEFATALELEKFFFSIFIYFINHPNLIIFTWNISMKNFFFENKSFLKSFVFCKLVRYFLRNLLKNLQFTQI